MKTSVHPLNLNAVFLACLLVLLLLVTPSPLRAGTVLVSDFANNQVLSYTVSGSGAWTLNSTLIASGTYGGIALTGPMGLATDGSSLYVAVTEGILRFSMNGSYLGTVRTNTAANAANGLTVDASSNLYYTVAFGSSTGLYKISTPSGTAVNSTIATGLSTPRGVAIGSNGHIYVTQRGAGTITEYAADGSLIGTLISGLGTVQALSWDDAGSRLLISYGTDLTHMSIGAVSEAGVLTQLYNNNGTATYFFNNSLGVVATEGYVFASSIQSNDISRITSSTTATDVVTGIDPGFMLLIVPEPTIFSLLLASGFALLYGRRRRIQLL